MRASCLVLLALVGWLVSSVCAAEELYFARYGGQIEVRTPQGAREVLVRDGQLALAAGETAFVTLGDAQTLRVRGADLRAGLAFGEPANAVVWQAPAREYRVYIPRALSAHQVAVRATRAGVVELALLSATRDRLKALRFREDAERWLVGRAGRPAPIDSASRRWLGLVSDVGARKEVRATKSFVEWAMLGLEQAYLAHQGLGSPWLMHEVDVDAEVDADHPLRVHAEGPEIVSVLVRPRLVGPIDVDLVRRDGLFARLSWTGWERLDERGYADVARMRRFVVDGDFSVLVGTGSAHVTVRKYVRTRTLTELWNAWLQKAEPRAESMLAPYVEGAFDRKDPFRGLPAGLLPAASLLSLDHAREPAEVSAWSEPALSARNFGTGQLRLAALYQLLRVGAAPAPSLCELPSQPAANDLHLAVDLALSDLCGAASNDLALGVRAFDALASRDPNDGVLLRVARELSRRVERALDVPLGERSAAKVVISVPDDLRKDGVCRASGRARILAAGEHILHGEGDHASVLTFRALDGVSSRVEVGPFGVSVQGEDGLGSRVRVPVGDVPLVVHDRPVLVELSAAGALPCAALRDVRIVWPTREPVSFPLATAHATSLGFELVSSDEHTPLSGEIRALAGSLTYDVSLLGRASRVRFELLASDQALSVTLDPRGQLLQARAFVSLGRRRTTKGDDPALPQLTPEQWLDSVRKASREIHAAPSEHPPVEALRRRAQALVALGHMRLAEHDYLRLASHGVYPPEASGERLGPLNLAAKLPPLPSDELVLLRTALRADELGQSGEAAVAFGKLPYALAEAKAAELRAELSWAEDDAALALVAYAWAVHARPGMSEEASASLRRLEAAVRYVTPLALDTSAGTYLETIDPRSEAESMRLMIGRAWLDVPDDAIVMREDEELSARLTVREPLTLRYEAACRALSSEACTVTLRCDGHKVTTPTFVVPPGAHDVELSTNVRGLGWMRLCPAEGECGTLSALLTPELKRRWFAASELDPARLSLSGPTVVRLALRSPAASEALVKLGDHEQRVATGPDQELKLELPVFEERSELVVTPADGLVYVRVSVAEPLKSAPLPLASLEAPENEQPRTAPILKLSLPTGREERRAGPLTLWAHERYVFAQVADLDAVAQGAPFLETEVRVLRMLPADIRAQVGMLTRTRAGADSFGFLTKLDIPQYNLAIPRLILSARTVGQNVPPWSWGLRSRASAYWRFGVGHGVLLMPWVAAHYRSSPLYAARIDAVDPDVYSNFYRNHNRGAWLGFTTYYRPLLDVSLQSSFYSMSNADFATLDRVGHDLSLNLMPGRGFAPWVTLTYNVSQRFKDTHRAKAFVRNQFEAEAHTWLWTTPTQRVALSANVGYLMDVRSFVGMIQLSWLWSKGRGVTDLTADEVEYRERMQEGALMADDFISPPGNQGVRGGE